MIAGEEKQEEEKGGVRRNREQQRIFLEATFELNSAKIICSRLTFVQHSMSCRKTTQR